MKLLTTSAIALIASTSFALADHHAEAEVKADMDAAAAEVEANAEAAAEELEANTEMAADELGEAVDDAGNAIATAANETAEAAGDATQDVATMADMGDTQDGNTLIRSRDITGSVIYTSVSANEDGWSMDSNMTSVGDDWVEVGEIEDIVIDRSGEIIGVVAEVGGFLDIMDKHVMLPIEDVSMGRVDNDTYVVVTAYNEEELEELESVDEGFWD